MKTSPHDALVSLETASALIRSGVALSVAGAESVLDRLPAGNWIGGTASYFTSSDGGLKSTEQVFITRLPADSEVSITHYTADNLAAIMRDAPANGFSFAIMPSGSPALRLFAEGSRFWTDIFLKPVVGWIAGVDLAELGRQTPKVYVGRDRSKHENGAVIAHVSLPADRLASIETVNIFERDPANVIRFATTGFDAVDCTINGRPARLADVLTDHGNADGRLPLIGDFGGASINVSIQAIDPSSHRVSFYAPVFTDVEYYLAKPVGNYATRFAEELGRRADHECIFSCNCILNYLYGELEGKKTGNLQGPVTFGEVAYLLHNQTMVVLTIA